MERLIVHVKGENNWQVSIQGDTGEIYTQKTSRLYSNDAYTTKKRIIYSFENICSVFGLFGYHSSNEYIVIDRISFKLWKS